jgi:hypothetical protein
LNAKRITSSICPQLFSEFGSFVGYKIPTFLSHNGSWMSVSHDKALADPQPEVPFEMMDDARQTENWIPNVDNLAYTAHCMTLMNNGLLEMKRFFFCRKALAPTCEHRSEWC